MMPGGARAARTRSRARERAAYVICGGESDRSALV